MKPAARQRHPTSATHTRPPVARGTLPAVCFYKGMTISGRVASLVAHGRSCEILQKRGLVGSIHKQRRRWASQGKTKAVWAVGAGRGLYTLSTARAGDI